MNFHAHQPYYSATNCVISSKPEPAAVKADTNDVVDDDDDSFEWKSATTPAETSVQTLFQPEPVSAPAPSQQDLFQWTPPSKPPSSLGKPLVETGSLSGLLSLAGGLPPSQIRIATSKEDDLFAALSSNSSNKSGGARNRQADMRPQSATESIHSSNPGDDSEDEFSDFVSTGAMPESTPLPASTQPPAGGHVNQPPAFDVSFFEAAEPVPTAKRNLDFFGDLMGLNFTNA